MTASGAGTHLCDMTETEGRPILFHLLTRQSRYTENDLPDPIRETLLNSLSLRSYGNI